MALQNAKANIQLFVTRRCQLRCLYCPVLKASADMPSAVAAAAVDFLMEHRGPRLRLDFGGGEPLLNFDLVRQTAQYAERRAREKGKSLSFYMVTNAIELDEAKLDWMSRRNFTLELSLDGDRQTHNRYKLAHRPGLDPYQATRRGVELALRSGIKCFVIMVASPGNVRRLGENFEHLLGLGARAFDLSYALGSFWSEEDQRAFFSQVSGIASRHARPLAGRRIRFGNFAQRLEPAMLNSELMVDTDGSLHLLSEWMFETARSRRPAPYAFGSVLGGADINSLYWSRFHCYYTLLRMHEHLPRARETILNNIAFGMKAGRFFSELSQRIHENRRADRCLA